MVTQFQLHVCQNMVLIVVQSVLSYNIECPTEKLRVVRHEKSAENRNFLLRTVS